MTQQLAAELLPIIQAFAQGKRVQFDDFGKWVTLDQPDFSNPLGKYRIAPEPRRVPLEANDWDGPVWWVRTSDSKYVQAVTGFCANQILITSVGWTELSALMDEGWQRSRDRVTWTPCYREVDQ